MGCHACLKRIGNLRDEVCLHHQEPAPVIPSLQLRALNDPYQQTMEESSCSSMANQHSSGTANWSPFNQSQHSPSHLVPWGAWALGNHNTPMRERERMALTGCYMTDGNDLKWENSGDEINITKEVVEFCFPNCAKDSIPFTQKVGKFSSKVMHRVIVCVLF